MGRRPQEKAAEQGNEPHGRPQHSHMINSRPKQTAIKTRLAELEWQDISHRMDEHGFATTPPLLTPAECKQLTGLYSDDKKFRSRIDMARFRFGEGEYKYFANPLPDLVQALREAAYPNLARIAN